MQSETYYHIYNHANGNENLFRSNENYHYFLRQWAKYIEPVAGTYAYCLMPNHFHFLIRTETSKVFENLGGLNTKTEGKIISQAFSNLFNSYTKAFNKMYNRRGSLFMSNFKSKEIQQDSHLTTIIHYIHRNPVHHGFTDSYEQWPHSSFPIYMSNKQTLLQRRFGLNWFGGLAQFKAFHAQLIKYPDKIQLE